MIDYFLVQGDDMAKIYDQFEVPSRLGFPTVAAVEGEKILGYMSTSPRKDLTLAGPMEASSGLIALRLAENYERLMARMGVTAYWFHVEHANQKWLNVIRKMGTFEQVAEDENVTWFKRMLPHGR